MNGDYSWAWIAIDGDPDDDGSGSHSLLIRRNDSTGELAYHRCSTGRPGGEDIKPPPKTVTTADANTDDHELLLSH